MLEEFPLFNPRAAARASDPVTSVMAAERAVPHVTKDRLAVLTVHYHHRYAGGLDDFQLAEFLDRKQTSVGKRRGELVEMGFIEPTGERRPSPSSLTNSVVAVWRITRAGIDFYNAYLEEKRKERS